MFLNLDLELRSRNDLGPLANHLERVASVLYFGADEGEYRLTVEPESGGLPGDTPERCSREMLATLEALPPHLMRLLGDCHQRVFDYGFEGGMEGPALSADLIADQVARIAALGLSLRFTVYSSTPDQA